MAARSSPLASWVRSVRSPTTTPWAWPRRRPRPRCAMRRGDLGPGGIRVNTVSPGAMRTLALAGIQGGRGMLAKGRSLSAMKENASMEGVAGTALWLLSDLGNSTTGELIHVDAGFHIMGFAEDETPPGE